MGMPATETPPPYPYQHQRIRFKDPDSGKTLVFLTNNMLLPSLNIAALYKSRWQVELFLALQGSVWVRQILPESSPRASIAILCAIPNSIRCFWALTPLGW